MIESSIINALAADVILTRRLATYNGAPAIFSEYAPEDAGEPNITIRLRRTNGPDDIVQLFLLEVDYWDYNTSRADSREAAERIEFVLDQAELEHERYAVIRCFFSSGEPLEEVDPRAVHYNSQFEIRAFRKKWIRYITGADPTTTTTVSP